MLKSPKETGEDDETDLITRLLSMSMMDHIAKGIFSRLDSSSLQSAAAVSPSWTHYLVENGPALADACRWNPVITRLSAFTSGSHYAHVSELLCSRSNQEIFSLRSKRRSPLLVLAHKMFCVSDSVLTKLVDGTEIPGALHSGPPLCSRDSIGGRLLLEAVKEQESLLHWSRSNEDVLSEIVQCGDSLDFKWICQMLVPLRTCSIFFFFHPVSCYLTYTRREGSAVVKTALHMTSDRVDTAVLTTTRDAEEGGVELGLVHLQFCKATKEHKIRQLILKSSVRPLISQETCKVLSLTSSGHLVACCHLGPDDTCRFFLWRLDGAEDGDVIPTVAEAAFDRCEFVAQSRTDDLWVLKRKSDITGEELIAVQFGALIRY